MRGRQICAANISECSASKWCASKGECVPVPQMGVACAAARTSPPGFEDGELLFEAEGRATVGAMALFARVSFSGSFGASLARDFSETSIRITRATGSRARDLHQQRLRRPRLGPRERGLLSTKPECQGRRCASTRRARRFIICT